MAEKDTDLQKIKKLIEIMRDNELLEVEIKHGDDKIFLKRSGPQQPAGGRASMIGQEARESSGVSSAPVSAASAGPSSTQAGETVGQAAALPEQQELVEITSPIVGTFYATPSPDSEPYVEVGSRVEPQSVVCIIEAMKVMNEIKAETGGTIVEILVTNGQAVEYGQVLFRVRPD